MEFLRIVVNGVIQTHSGRGGEPRQHVVTEARTQHVAVFLVLTNVAVVNPIGVLHGNTGVAHGPILRVDLTRGVVTLIHQDVFPVVATGEQISAQQGVVVLTLINHVAVVLPYVAGIYVEGHLIVKHGRGVTHVEVVTIVFIIRCNAT